ncbi:MAG: CBS domain-containing protein [Elusimicrobiota bacterium]
MLTNFLRLQEVTVAGIMTTREKVSTIERALLFDTPEASATRERAIFSLLTDGHTRTLVLQDGRPSGYIHAKDLIGAVGKGYEEGLDLKIDPGVGRPLPMIAPERSVLDIVSILLRDSPIVGVEQYGVWMGIVTAEDILEEVTGEILDEFEPRKREAHHEGERPHA